jgi:hypothetical protein
MPNEDIAIKNGIYGGTVTAATLAFVILALGSVSAFAQNARRVAQETFPSVVLLLMNDKFGQPVSLGSGFFVASNIVATNHHVIEGATSGYAKLIGKNDKHKIIGLVAQDSNHDLVLLALSDVSGPALPIGDSSQMAVGDDVYVVGNPRGLEGTFSQGIVSGIRTIETDHFLQITAPISPGSSGGPVLNSQGKVVGVAVATFKGGQNLNFAIPSSYLITLTKRSAREPQPLSEVTPPSNSITNVTGQWANGAVYGAQFAWEKTFPGQFNFSIHNQLTFPVSDIDCLVVFYDKGGFPLDFATVHWNEPIPPGLAKRVAGVVGRDVWQATTSPDSSAPSTTLEIRVLDFKILDE